MLRGQRASRAGATSFVASALTASFAVLASLAPAADGAPAPQEGVYHGLGYGDASQCKTNEGEGWFRLKRGHSGKLKIVAPGSYPYREGPAVCHAGMYDAKITAPSDLNCNQFNADLPVKSVKVKQARFDWTGNAPIGPNHSNVHVRFKGHWVDDTHLKGYTRISSSQCDSGKFRWQMHKLK